VWDSIGWHDACSNLADCISTPIYMPCFRTVRSSSLTAIFGILLAGWLAVSSLWAVNLTWDADGVAGGSTGGAGIWDTSSLLWNDAGVMKAWNNAGVDVAIFGGTGGTVTLAEAISAGGLIFNTTGYTLAGGGHSLTLKGTVTTQTNVQALLQASLILSGNLAFTGSGNLTLDAAVNSAGFALSKGGTGTLTLAGEFTEAGQLSISGGVVNLSGSYSRSAYASTAGLNVTGGTLNITGTLGTSASVPVGQTAFSGNSVTNFSGTAYMTGGSATFRVGEGSSATVNVTAGTLTLGTSSAGLALGRNNANASGFLNISGGSMIVAGAATRLRIGAGYADGETSGASEMTLSGTGLFDTLESDDTATILLGSNLAGNTASSGTIHLNGGTLATGRKIIGGSVGASIFNFNGGTLKANSAGLTLDTSLTTVNVRDGGAIINTNGFDISIAKSLVHSTIDGDAEIDGGLTKIGNGVLTFNGSEANTYTGMTRLLAGSLELAKSTGVVAIAGDLTLGDGTAGVLLKLINSEQIADHSVVQLHGAGAAAGVFQLNGKTETIGGLSSSGGAGIVENESANSTTLILNTNGTLSYSGQLRNGSLTGTLSLVKGGPGTQILASASSYTGSTTLNEGVLQFGVDQALSNDTAVVFAAAGGTAELDLAGRTWQAGTISFYNASSTETSQAILRIGSDGLLTLSSNITVNNNQHPLGAWILGGTLDFGGVTRTFTVADSSNALVDLTIDADVTSVGSYGLVKAGAGTLRLSGSVTLTSSLLINTGTVEVAGPLSTGNGFTQVGTTTPGSLRILPGADYQSAQIFIGASQLNDTKQNRAGAVVVAGGNLTTTSSSASSGIIPGAESYGGLFVTSGTVSTQRVDSQDGTSESAVTVVQVSGGTLNTASYIMFRNQRWEFTVTGGEVLRTGNHIALGYRGSATADGVMTMAGGLVNNAGYLLTFGQQNDERALATAALNLNAGTLITNSITHYNSNNAAATTARLNFNGGLLRASVNGNFVSSNGTAGAGTFHVYVNGPFGEFAGGARIDSNGYDVTVPVALLAPTGNGVTDIAVDAGGSGYIGAPYVEISGGGGVGATASAEVDLDPASPTYGQLLRITITNPGVGYTSEPTITLLGGGGSGAVLGAATLASNSSGGLHKSGNGSLTLSGAEANTFTGASSVTAGELRLAKTAGVTAIGGDLTIGDGSALAVVHLNANEQIADTSLISFVGSGANAGILRLNNKSETVGGLISSAGAGIVENESGSLGTAILTLHLAAGAHHFSGVLRNGDESGIDGVLALVKTGQGTQVLGGLNTYTGTTTVAQGVLQLAAGASTGSGAVSIENGGILAGTGTVRGTSFTAASGAVIHAGDGVGSDDYGTLNLSPLSGSGDIQFQEGSTIVLGLNPEGASDRINIQGTGSNTLSFLGGFTVTAPGFVPTAPAVFDLIDWSGLSGSPIFAAHYSPDGWLYGNGDEAAGLDLPDIYGSGYAWDLSQFTSTGSLVLVLVPEPSRLLLLGLAGVLVLGRRRRDGLTTWW
jgi:autotransporter-associated beta strand protein